VHAVIPPSAILGYTTGGAVMTLVLPLGFFIVVMTAFYFVFTRPHTVPGHRDEGIGPARPVAPEPGTARDMAAAAGFMIAPSGGGPAPLADRGTPPVVGAARHRDAEKVGEDEAGPADAAAEGPADASAEGQGESE
jgi:hypothetical protein